MLLLVSNYIRLSLIKVFLFSDFLSYNQFSDVREEKIMQLFILSGIVAAIVMFIISFILRKMFPTRSFDISFGFMVVILCIVGFLGSMFFNNGWEGMAYGFLCFFILIGALIGMVLHQIMKIFKKGASEN